ncbi:MAG: UvrD-helicase domain-containing protein [Bacteroidota bacterium]|jgi:ATP-dependent helicase/nuclease subunit A
MNAQQKAALDTHVHCAVLANAGAGKTQVLVQRLLRILVVENVEIDAVVAITFTRAAAMEMRQRLHHLIDGILAGTEEPAPYLGGMPRAVFEPRLRRVLMQIGSARISTFHSFCASLVRQYADVVGRSADVRDADDRLSTELTLEALDATMQHFLVGQRMSDPRVQAVFDALTVNTIQSTVQSLARNSADLRKLGRVLTEPREQILERRQTFVQQARTRQAHRLAVGLMTFLQAWTHVPEIATLCGIINQQAILLSGGDPAACAAFESTLGEWFTKKLTIRKEKLSKSSKQADLPGEPDKGLHSIAAMLRTIWDAETEEHQLTVAQGIAVLAERAAQEYAEIKRRRNVMDFDDMIDDATNLLSNPHVAPIIRGSISHIMIDEFQDTDPTQFHLLELLAPALHDATIAGPNVFVVGDDKQSIYGFRNADVRLFRRARRSIRRANAAVTADDDGLRPLTESYRMHQDLATSVNTICRHAFGAVNAPDDDDELSFDVAYMALTAAVQRSASPQLSSTRVLEITPEALESASEFDHLAAHLVQMLDEQSGVDVFEKHVASRRAQPGDIAVLVRNNSAKSQLADALRRRGLPYTIYGGRSFFSRPEIADVRAALRAAIDPRNDLATATALRSPLLRCPDVDIVRASLRGRKTSLQDGLADLVSSGEASSEAAFAVGFFAHVRTLIAVQPVSDVIEPMLDHCRWHAAVARDSRYTQMVANIDKLIDICRRAEQNRSASLADVLTAISEPERDLEAEGTVMSAENAIHVMTIHASKGLEFPIVALTDLGSSSRTAQFIISDQIGPTIKTPSEIVPAANARAVVERPPALTHLLNQELDRERDEAEQRRLLYVALTRAKAHLVLCLPTADVNDADKGLTGILNAATAQAGPWTRITCTANIDHRGYRGSGRTAGPLSVAFEPLVAPQPLIMTASALNKSASAHTSSVRRRILGAENASTAYGTAVHAALAEVIRSVGLLDDQEIVQRIVSVMKAHDLDRDNARKATAEVLAVVDHALVLEHADVLRTAVIEGTLTALHRETIIEGVLDLRLTALDGAVEIWDWKTNVVRSERHTIEIAESYAMQMRSYAWLCMQAVPGCERVRTRLVFTKAATEGHHVIDVTRSWDKGSLSTLVVE